MAPKATLHRVGTALRSASFNTARPACRVAVPLATTGTTRHFSAAPRCASLLTSVTARSRPTLGRSHATPSYVSTNPGAKRTIFIQTEDTPNVDALKFRPNSEILPQGFSSSFVEYMTPRSTLAAPHPSPLAAQLMNVDGVKSVFYGKDYITVTKESGTNWAHVKPEIFSLITVAVTNGQPIVNVVEGTSEHGAASGDEAIDYASEDEEVIGMIQELLETRIRPAIQEDGGDIELRGFRDGIVKLKLRGACRTCDSSTVTLKNGIESMLMHYIEEVKSVEQVLDQEEEIAIQEFAKFEEKLRAQQGAAPSSL